jgi:hypothetical protein
VNPPAKYPKLEFPVADKLLFAVSNNDLDTAVEVSFE